MKWERWGRSSEGEEKEESQESRSQELGKKVTGDLAGQWQSTDLNPDPGFESSTLFSMSTTPGPKMMSVEGLGDTQG